MGVVKKTSDDVVAGTTRGPVVPPELWSEFDVQLVALFDKTKEAEKSYVQGRGMSLASIAVGSALLRLSKVRAAAESREFQRTKEAVANATPKIREASFTSTGDPENAGLMENLAILEALEGILDRMENSSAGSGRDGGDRPGSKRTQDGLASHEGDAGEDADDALLEKGDSAAGATNDRGSLVRDLGIMEPDDDPLSCLADEAGRKGSDGGKRPSRRPLVAPVDPALAERERNLYWGPKATTRNGGRVATGFGSLAPTSLAGEGRPHLRTLHAALLQQTRVDDQRGFSVSPVTTPALEEAQQGHQRQEETDGRAVSATEDGVGQLPPPPGIDLIENLRKDVRQGRWDDPWSRLSLAYTLEEQGEFLATVGSFFESSVAYSEASAVFQECATLLPGEPESLLRQWITARRAREVGVSTAKPPDAELLRRCIKMCGGWTDGGSRVEESSREGDGASSGCGTPSGVCYEASLELAGAWLESGNFTGCLQACRHVLGQHDADNAEALHTLAQALEALGRSREARELAERAERSLLLLQ